MRASHWLLGTALIAWAGAVSAQGTRDRHRYDLQEQDLGSALRAFGLESGRDVVADARLLQGKRAEALKGEFDDRTALQRLLKGSGLHYALVRGAYIIRGEERAAPEGNGDDILVVGTRIRGAAPVGSPVTIIDRAAMEKAGRGTIQGLLETVPANFGGGPNEATVGVNTRNGSIDNTGLGSAINLRGLGSAATLVLFDGNRPALGGTDGTFADISLIPQIAIDRIEVLTDGASAIYGTDAVAGVVNFRFRDRFEGLDTSFRIGTADGDFEEYQLGAIAGKRWATGGIVIAYQYSDRDHLPGSQRRFATSDLRPFGGPDYRSKFTTPATIMAADGRIFGIPAGQDGRSLTAEQLLPGVQYYRDNQREDDLLPVQRSHAVFGAFDQELTDNLKVYARAFYAQRNFKFLQPNGFQQTVKVPASNAFYVDPIGTRQPLTVFYNFAADLGHEFRKGSVEGLSLNGGLEWSLGPWRIEASGNFGDQLTDFKIGNIANRARLAQALADSNPATAYNVFGDGGDTPEATIARIRGGARLTAHDQAWSAALRADGPLIALPTGMARLAAGYEHRDERIRASLTSDTSSLQPATFSLLDGRTHRSIEAAYAELLVPVSGGDPARVGMQGLSFGSQATMWMASHTRVLRAAAIASGQFEPSSYWVYADKGRDFVKVLAKAYGLGDPVATAKAWRTSYPSLLPGVPMPPMLMQLPESEARWSMQLFRRLQGKTPVQLYAFADASHVKSSPRQLLAAGTRNLAWFRFWLQGELDSDPSEPGRNARWVALADEFAATLPTAR